MGFPSFNLCDSEENIGSQDHPSHCTIKPSLSFPFRRFPVSINTFCNCHARGTVAAGVWGMQASQTLQLF